MDLPVRSSGHIEPEHVDRDLPKAVQAKKDYGLIQRMITTAVDDAGDETDRYVIQASSDLGTIRKLWKNA